VDHVPEPLLLRTPFFIVTAVKTSTTTTATCDAYNMQEITPVVASPFPV
jgi:hypothetical protein